MLRFVPAMGKPTEEQQNSIESIRTALGISDTLAALLVSRGHDTVEKARFFLEADLSMLHDPMLLDGMAEAVELLEDAIIGQLQITVYGDYDVDGTCGTSILLHYLRSRDAQVDHYIPDRHSEGYGLNGEAVEKLYERGTDVLVTVDCGITNVEEVAFAQQLGMEVIVTDHHECPEVLPECLAVINAKKKGQAYPFSGICGAVTAAKLVQALGGTEAVLPYLDLMAVATVADMVPLVDENRIILREGLARMAEARPGILALLACAGLEPAAVKASDLAFQIGPRMNACGRMGDARDIVKLLLTEDERVAKALAVRFDQYNSERRRIDDLIERSARQKVEHDLCLAEHRAIVLWEADWNASVQGIVASQLVERYHKPVILLAKVENEWRGSARSIPGVHIQQMLTLCKNRFLRFGGHEQAAGLSMEEDQLEYFAEELERVLRENYAEECFIPSASYDLALPAGKMTTALAEELARLEPYGTGNPSPRLLMQGVKLDRVRGMSEDKHFRATAFDDAGGAANVVAFNRTPPSLAETEQTRYELLVNLEVNTWRGRSDAQCRVTKLVRHQVLRGTEESLALQGRAAFWKQALLISRRKSDPSNTDLLYMDAQGLLDDWIEHVQQGAMGTLALVMEPEAMQEALARIEALGLQAQVNVVIGAPEDRDLGQNCLVLAPDWKALRFGHYTEVYCLGGGFYTNSLDFIVRQLHNRRLQIIMKDNPRVQKKWIAERLSDDQLRRIYAAMHRALMQGSIVFANARHPAQWLASLCGIAPHEAELALGVFSQLGFVTWEGNAPYLSPVDRPRKRALTESVIYERMTQLERFGKE